MTGMTTDTTALRADISGRAAALFAAIDDYADDADFIAAADALAAELPAGDADGLFHRACARDSRGYSGQAVPLYRAALAAGDLGGEHRSGGQLSEEHRRRAVIQLASSMRNTGETVAALALLEAERERGSDELDDALACVTALCLSSLGRDREGLSLAVVALAAHLPRYNRSMANYARALVTVSGASLPARHYRRAFTVVLPMLYHGVMTERKPKGMSFTSWIDQQILDAQRRGLFDDLPGAGKPLDLKSEPGGDYGQAWVRDYARREGVPPEEFLPTPLRLRRETEKLAEAVREMRTEDEVREAVADLNRRILEWRKIPDGPPIYVRLVNKEQLLAVWREAHPAKAAPPAAAASAPAPAPAPAPVRQAGRRGWRRLFTRRD
jgi:hypothetical protein